jgi:pyruvate-formate lyase-activating enzyme
MENKLIQPEDFTPEFYRRYGIKKLQVSIDIMHCNARCEFCYLPPTLQRISGPGVSIRNDERNYALLKAFVINFSNSRRPEELPMEPIDFIGGEIAMYPHNIIMLKEWILEAPDLKFHFVTNGLYFRKNWAELSIKTESVVNFSLNGYDEKSHEERMKMGFTWNKVLKNARDYMRMTDHVITLSFVISPKTIREKYFTKICEMLKREFIDQGLTNFKVNFNTNIADADMSFEPTFQHFEKDEEMLKSFLEEIPIMDSMGILDKRKLRIILSVLKADQALIDKIINDTPRIECNSRMTIKKDTQDDEPVNDDPDPWGLEYLQTIYQVRQEESALNNKQEEESALNNKQEDEKILEMMKMSLMEI